MNRFKLYWNYATRSLRRGGQRTLLAIFCIAVGVMAVVSLELVGNMVNTALTGNVRGALGGDISVQSGIGPIDQQDLSVFADLQANGTLTQYTAVVDTQVQAVVKGQVQRFELLAVDPKVFPLAGAPDFSDPRSGSLSSLLTGNTVVVTDSLLSQLGLHKGDQLTVESPADGRSFSATIGGVIATSGFFDQPQMLLSVDTYAALPSTDGVPVQYNAVYANVPGHTGANQDRAVSAISQALLTATITTTKDELQQNQAAVQNLRYFLEIVGLLALLIGGVGIVNTMQVLLRRRHIEIAMLKTSGYRQGDLYALFGLETGLLGLIGGVVGTVAGIGAAVVVKIIVENALLLHLDFSVDSVTLLDGVTIGFLTALIFGIMPIVQAGQTRPQELLRDLSLGYTARSAALTVFLVALLGVLFFVLSAVILGSIQLALLLVFIGVVVLGILTAVFTLVVYLISQLPVPESLDLGFAGLVIAGMVVFGGLTWLGFSHGWSGIPAMTALFTAISLFGLAVAFLPRTWKSNIKMALRNIGRQRTRTVTTMVALFIGVFAIGLILAIGIGIRNDITGLLNNGTTYNAFIGVNAADKAAVDRVLSKISGIKGKLVTTVAPVQPVSVNGKPIDSILKAASTQGTGGQILSREELLAYLSHAVGYDLAADQIPAVNIVSGRNLEAGDAGTNRVLMPEQSTFAPLDLSVGSQIVLAGSDGKATRTVTVVGFYSTSTGGVTISLNGRGMIGDNSVPTGLAQGRELYNYELILNPSKAASDLNKVVEAVPSAQTVNLAQLSVSINSILNNFIIMLTAIASLAMIAAVIIIANAVALAMLERRREQGILKSVGFTSGGVLSEVLVENGVVGFTGGVLAMLLVSLVLFILGLQVRSLNFGVANGLVLVIIGGTAAVSVMVALLVAWNATRVRPLAVLRYE